MYRAGFIKQQQDAESMRSSLYSECWLMAGLYRASHDFNCDLQYVLTFKRGQVVEVTKASSNDNWYRGRINGKAGFLPANGYLKKINLEKCEKVVARQSFDPAMSGQLKVVEGENLTVVVKQDAQWWTVRAESGKWGMVPAKYLKLAANITNVGNKTRGQSSSSDNGSEASLTARQPVASLNKQGSSLPISKVQSVPVSIHNHKKLEERASSISLQSRPSTSGPSTSGPSPGLPDGPLPHSATLARIGKTPIADSQLIGSFEIGSSLSKLIESSDLFENCDDSIESTVVNESNAANAHLNFIFKPSGVGTKHSTPLHPKHPKQSRTPKHKRVEQLKSNSLSTLSSDFTPIRSPRKNIPKKRSRHVFTRRSSVRTSFRNKSFRAACYNIKSAKVVDVVFKDSKSLQEKSSKKCQAVVDTKNSATSTSNLLFLAKSCSCVPCVPCRCDPAKTLLNFQSKEDLMNPEFSPVSPSTEPDILKLNEVFNTPPLQSTDTMVTPEVRGKRRSAGGKENQKPTSRFLSKNLVTDKENRQPEGSFTRKVNQYLTELDEIRFSGIIAQEEEEAAAKIFMKEETTQEKKRSVKTKLFRSMENVVSPGKGQKSGDEKSPAQISRSLVEGVRNCGVRYETSKEIVVTLLDKLGSEFPEWEIQLSLLAKSLDIENDESPGNVSADAIRLEQLFDQLNTLTQDEQQRGWSCKNDTHEIDELLDNISNLLRNANPKVMVRVLVDAKYEPLYTLVQYYQLEKRGQLKEKVLIVLFDSMKLSCDPVCSILLTSRLPVQLAVDVQACTVLSQLEQQCKVFTGCLCLLSSMPRNHYEQLDATFINFLFDGIESPLSCDPELVTPQYFLECLLALNLHYADLEQNKICDVLKERSHATVMTEMLLVAFNRGDNPTDLFYTSSCPNSVIKLLKDMLSDPHTAGLFFTNDVKVLLEVLQRNILDRGEGDTERSVYLALLNNVIEHTDYEEHEHIKDELREMLCAIEEEEGEDQSTQELAREIRTKYKFFNPSRA